MEYHRTWLSIHLYGYHIVHTDAAKCHAKGRHHDTSTMPSVSTMTCWSPFSAGSENDVLVRLIESLWTTQNLPAFLSAGRRDIKVCKEEKSRVHLLKL